MAAEFENVEMDPVGFINSIDLEFVKNAFDDAAAAEKLAVGSLLTFVIANFTGPTVNLSDEIMTTLRSQVPENFKDDLDVNGETFSHLAKYPELVWISQFLLKKFPCSSLWYGRTAVVWQKCISGPSEILKEICMSTLTGIELAISYRLFHEYNKFIEFYEEYAKSSGFEFELTGILGKRTRFQQESKAQLVVKVSNSASKRGDAVPLISKRSAASTREVKLDEDTATLERVVLDEDVESVNLTAQEISLLLLESSAVQDRYASETKDEKRIALLNTVLDYDVCHSVVTVAMYEKSLVEKNDAYAQQRAALQLEAIINEFDDPEHPAVERLEQFWSLQFPPLWEIRREMGMQFLMIGSAKTAANIFIEHQMWEELALCCNLAKDVALAVDTLTKQPDSPLVLCLLGELQEDKELLEKSWNMSNGRFSRAQRSLGRYYIHREAWKEAINAFELALALNSLYPDAWFSLGCSRMRLEMWNEAIVAFQQVVSQKQDDSESFSNLAICLMTVNKYSEAHSAITQAIRFDRKNFKLWENFIVISLGADKVNDSMLGLEELGRAHPKWCNCPLLLEVCQKVEEVKGDMERFINIMNFVAENADCGWDFYTVFADVLEAAGLDEKGFEMRINVMKRLEENGKVTEVDFEKLVTSAGHLAACVKRLPNKKRSVTQRIKILLKKYDDFTTTDSYKKLEEIAASLA